MGKPRDGGITRQDQPASPVLEKAATVRNVFEHAILLGICAAHIKPPRRPDRFLRLELLHPNLGLHLHRRKPHIRAISVTLPTRWISTLTRSAKVPPIGGVVVICVAMGISWVVWQLTFASQPFGPLTY